MNVRILRQPLFALFLGTLFGLPAWAHPAPQTTAQDDATSRELYGLAEEQAMLSRQIQRLRQTMDVLAGRLEAEGRTRAVELLREGLVVLDQRREEAAAMTLDERMDAARTELAGGQWMQSLERQQSIISDLEALLEVLLDRQDLDKLEERIEELAAAKADLEALSSRESELRKETELEEQRNFEAALGEWSERLEGLVDKQLEALRAAESAARKSGALERERIERRVTELALREAQLAELLAAWSPSDRESAREAESALKEAADRNAGAKALEAAAKALEDAAAGLAADASLEALDQTLKNTEAQLASQPSSARAEAMAALAAAREALAKAREAGRKATGEELEAGAQAAREAAAEEAAAAAEAAERAAEALEPSATDKLLGAAKA
nr:hypothetical protein [Planctomycetota bacterium]